ncbi:unnamed protein product [Brassica rapa]|uniref:Uncharacterized protein n=1 Tax=Brassica campestris TaxID=3711 RepID=A0A8D9HEI2_BRACM|nr:unnamed protein product [Brassica rapa]
MVLVRFCRSYTTYLEREVSKISTATKKGESCKKRKREK